MRKRKPPIMAVTILLVCLVAAVGFNYKSGINPKAVSEQDAPPPVAASTDMQAGAARPTESVSDVAKAVKSQMGTVATTPKAKAMGGPPGKMRPGMGGPGMNPIEMPKMGSSKPVPNESAVSSQWYQSDSSKN